MQETCICAHSVAAHQHGACAECKCEHYHRRPCVCGHPAAGHTAACHETGCICRKYRMDGSPEAMLRMGIHAGEWRFITVPQLQALQRPGEQPRTRIYATGLLHTQGRRRLAMIRDDQTGKDRPMQPEDFVRTLNALDTVGRIDKHVVRKTIRELEQEGKTRKVGKTRKNIRLFFYARPLRSRDLPDLPEPIEREPVDLDPEEPDLGVSDLGVNPDPQISASPSKGDHLQNALILPLRGILVKKFRETLRQELADAPDLGVNLDPQILIDEVVEELLLGVCAAYQKIRLGVWNPDAYKEERARASSNPSSSGKPLETPVSPSVVPFPEETDRRTKLRLLLKPLCQKLKDIPTERLIGETLAALGATPLSYLEAKIQDRWRKITGLGMVLGLAQDAANIWASEEEDRKAEAARRPPPQKRDDPEVVEAWEQYRDDEVARLMSEMGDIAYLARLAEMAADIQKTYPRLPKDTVHDTATRALRQEIAEKVMPFDEWKQAQSRSAEGGAD